MWRSSVSRCQALSPARDPARDVSRPLYDFVERAGARRRSIGRVAHPSAVYYTRLLVSGAHGRRYILRIRRDLDEGAPLSWVHGALRIAHRFGTEDRVRPKVEELVR